MGSEGSWADAGGSAAERIRRSARQLFYNRGIRAVGVDAIVAEAGVTKPSLYRCFASKDELAIAYLRDMQDGVWANVEAALAAHPGDPRAQVLAYFDNLARRTKDPETSRGCALSNAIVEFPELHHPVRAVAVEHKRALRARLTALAGEIGAPDPARLGDGLFLLAEGAYVAEQCFGSDGPAAHLRIAADDLIAASLRKRMP